MPSESKAQRRAAAMAEHATPEELESAGPAVQQMASSMDKSQLREFAKTKEEGLPRHKHKKHHHEASGRKPSGEGRQPRGRNGGAY